ncbi:MAG: NUDIX domain-containing protein [Microcoleus sp. PH2017_10_PVI_O_A]|uniref:NUDIX hydrolase n=1 Tax=unclassified Microcoleus TaxID=2642155 RepID=UPI001DE42636|nr:MULTISPECIES: NUDIX domain-containing protein [unclassified Microcoleus]TAE80548.1 MAG: NUDIX domain-containing protein [Oscillatoriales cyanobacterium]MCC3405806.1 NUDIX domain-containing protein [Microcoleus sp. PH2017_10_PVI_O_A]MCC3459888.1 NUDIX domain-containing protein [Microcoleus sp. PH2017_11_PCY_U_A]MCC3478312.1 NUDIX domain-containing protein [Microcoleus sp. PH2017_12_PCY_D_A]MCC3559255.1 NUDIX domain-containing protein [Microcoleus sp. PH2017_27_LUM_O_A]
MVQNAAATVNLQVSKAFLYQGSRLLLQLRDNIPEIIAPDRWGLFGGSVEAGETPVEAMKREIAEELCWMPPEPKYLLTWEVPDRACTIYIFGIPLTVGTSQLTLTEGQAFQLFTFEELTQLPLVPKIPRMLPQVVEAIDFPELSLAWQEFTTKKLKWSVSD